MLLYNKFSPARELFKKKYKFYEYALNFAEIFVYVECSSRNLHIRGVNDTAESSCKVSLTLQSKKNFCSFTTSLK